MTNALKFVHEVDTAVHFRGLMYDMTANGFLSVPLSGKKPLRHQWLMKSGSMEGIRSVAGYVLDMGVPHYAYCIMVNHYGCSGRKMAEKLADLVHELDRNIKIRK